MECDFMLLKASRGINKFNILFERIINIVELKVKDVCLTADFGEVKTAPTGCKEKCFQIMSSAL